MVSSHAYRLRRADRNGASVECSLVSPCRLRLVLFLSRLAFAIARSVIGDIRPVSRIAGRCGRAGRLYLLAVVCSFDPVSSLSSACSFLTHRHLLGHERSPVVSFYLLRLVRAGHHSACGVVGHPRSSCVGMWGRFCLLASPSCPLIVSVLFLVPCCCPFRFSSLFFPSCDTAGGELLCGVRLRLARRLCRCLP